MYIVRYGAGHSVAPIMAAIDSMLNFPLEEMDHKDYLDNGPLHYAAMVRKPLPGAFIYNGSGSIKAQSRELISWLPVSAVNDVNFKAKFSEIEYDWTAWITWVALEHCFVWIDAAGDTGLIALVMYWSYNQDELFLDTYIKDMVHLGAQIHM